MSTIDEAAASVDSSLCLLPAALADTLGAVVQLAAVMKKTYASQIKGIQENANASTRSVIQASKAEAAAAIAECQRDCEARIEQETQQCHELVDEAKTETEAIRCLIDDLLR